MLINLLFTKTFVVILGRDRSKGATSISISFLNSFFGILAKFELRSVEWNTLKEP